MFSRNLAGAALCLLALSPWTSASAERPNALFLAIDDLNDWVGVLGGYPQAQTPHIDRLAERGMLFTNAHCQARICNPSRASLMTGTLPSSTGVYQMAPDFRTIDALKDLVTIPEHFAREGYRTLGAGKVFHGSYPDTISFGTNGPRPGFGPRPAKKLHYPMGHPLWDWGAYPDKDAEVPDNEVADWFIEQVANLGAQPFFFAVGFYRPLVPLYAPPQWFHLYPLDSMILPPVKSDDLDDIPAFALKLTQGCPPRVTNGLRTTTSGRAPCEPIWRALASSITRSAAFSKRSTRTATPTTPSSCFFPTMAGTSVRNCAGRSDRCGGARRECR